jgi:methylthioribose-1-phosphate isomerase
VRTTKPPATVAWSGGAGPPTVDILDQTRLPDDEVMLHCESVDDVVGAIKRLSVRGAPAIGVTGAYGVALAAHHHTGTALTTAVEELRHARPTAINLARMVDRTAARLGDGPAAALEEAHAIRDEELHASIGQGTNGADLLLELAGHRPLRVMTICNSGALASVERGTALAVVQTLHERGLLAEALPLETRPLMQGSRLTAWELRNMGAPHRLIVDSAAAFLLSRGVADAIVVGADRIAANGDTANKVGTFALALGARHAGVPFVVVAPESTLDPETPTGAEIEIEDRGPDEVRSVLGRRIAPEGTDAINPAFDVTPVALVTALVTDRRVVRYDRGETITGSLR